MHGRKYRFVREVRTNAAQAVDLDDSLTYSLSRDAMGNPTDRNKQMKNELLSKSDEELADRLRTIVFRNGKEYEELERPLDRASKFRQHLLAELNSTSSGGDERDPVDKIGNETYAVEESDFIHLWIISVENY